MTGVEVTTGARLHFGLMCGAPDSGWHYGGIGMMIDTPAWHVRLAGAANAPADRISASPAVQQRIAGLLSRFRRHEADVGPVQCAVPGETDFHAGLGSGTQLTLAVATGLKVLAGQGRPADIGTVAARLGRNRRSAIGTFGFDHGGFVVDRGKSHSADSARQRLHFPDEWRMLLICPTQTQGLYGRKEEHFFGTKAYLQTSVLQQIASEIESGVLPGLRDHDYHTFATALATYGRLIGEYYASEQGGIYSSALIRDLAEWLRSQNLPQPVQSSWGPTVCIPAESVAHAETLTQAVSDRIGGDSAVTITVAKGLNSGALVRTIAPENQRSFG